MKTYRRNTIAALLTLTLTVTVGADESYAQRGKSLRGAFQRSSGNNGGGKGISSTPKNNGPKLQIGGNLQNGKGLQNNNGLDLGRNRNLQTGNGSLFPGNNGNSNRGGLQIGTNKGITLDNLKPKTGNSNRGGGLQQIIGKGRGNLPNLLNRGNAGSGQNGSGGLNTGNGKLGIGGLTNGNGNAGNGKANIAGKIFDIIKHNQQHNKVCVPHHDWCHTKPKHCHWWYHWCKPIAYCEPQDHVHCSWNYVTCDYLVNGHVSIVDARWYLGLKGLLLPGQGVGIEEVTPGSPAAAVGLQPGMVITRCNGIDMVDEAALGLAIEQSGGVLRMDLRIDADGPPATCVVVMTRVASLSY